ncbi:molybdopterin converting factor subunit 1 [Parasphingorhabdus halotolerans]|uniref:Molybdopterin synthase sulfur carrier subunit n=1 Tax=Parasphingorhabdus halotolerans TaxID=2725558 RepID=A0A6H2DKM1_9SPHN|nr:molybdopterin converting factor subunit 1 [Parasphingorhabdus halotolerans]QJB68495.1 molybdopterin converting factor subunit 1 [Parasphingorhabdus halotolerans]
MADTLTIIYFAWVKERRGCSEEQIVRPAAGTTVAELLQQLQQHDASYRSVFADTAKLRFALDQNFVQHSEAIDDADELAIFPPVTGG